MTAPRAADLPVGSIVARRTYCLIKATTGNWERAGDEGFDSEADAQVELDLGAQVLRVGGGSIAETGEHSPNRIQEEMPR